MTHPTIQTKIYEIRGLKVMFDYDLAALYEVETRVLKQAVKRNIDRFPSDFMFPLTEDEIKHMVSQIVIPSKSYLGGALPYAFTEQGVAMLSSVLSSKKALEVNIAIMRAFVLLRQFALTNIELSAKLAELEKKCDKQFKDVYEAIGYLIQKDQEEITFKERKLIGYK